MVIEDETFSYWPETLGMEDEEQSSIASSNSNYSIDKRLYSHLDLLCGFSGFKNISLERVLFGV